MDLQSVRKERRQNESDSTSCLVGCHGQGRSSFIHFNQSTSLLRLPTFSLERGLFALIPLSYSMICPISLSKELMSVCETISNTVEEEFNCRFMDHLNPSYSLHSGPCSLRWSNWSSTSYELEYGHHCYLSCRSHGLDYHWRCYAGKRKRLVRIRRDNNYSRFLPLSHSLRFFW